MKELTLTEIPPLSEKDCFHVVERFKTEFTFPLHRHKELEINFIEHGAGLKRIVGDSVQTISDYELVLIGGENLEHAWEQGECRSGSIREVTIQFSPDLLGENILTKNQFSSIRDMLVMAEYGISFPMKAIMSVYSILNNIVSEPSGFRQFLLLLELMYELSLTHSYEKLSSGSFAHVEKNPESGRVKLVKEYINNNFKSEIRLNTLSEMTGMSAVSFSRFFKIRTGKTLSDYIIDIRLGHASRLLVDTTMSIAEICYECGFNNLSNFNRIFKRKKNITPKEFRAYYYKHRHTI